MMLKPFAVLSAAAIAVAIASAGCSKGDQSTSTTTTTATTEPVVVSTAPGATPAADTSTSSSASTTTTAASGDATHGKSIYSANCTACHGATGTEGGVGPSLKNEKSRKNFAQTVAWIKNPQPPMPKLYPAPLAEKDVDDVAAYVQSL